MRIIAACFCTTFWLVMLMQGQLAPEISSKLQSSDWMDRREAFQILAANPRRSSEVDTALVALLLKEDNIIRTNPKSRPAGYGDGEGWGEYLGMLSGTVQSIAESRPDQKDVWRALAWSSYNEVSKFAGWLAMHADKTAPLLMDDANSVFLANADEWQKFLGGQAIVVLAQILAFERDPMTRHRLDAAHLAEAEATIRRGLEDPDNGVRYQAIKALALFGTSQDIGVLEGISTTDPYFETGAGATGRETRYFNREAARDAADRLRKRLSEHPN